jgi:general stress protein 26
MQNKQNSLDDKQFTDWIADFISSVDYSELITVADKTPHIRPMIYVSEGVYIYMVTGNDTGKLRQIQKNPNVSVMIIKSLSEVSDSREVIVSGRAEMVEDSGERDRVFGLFQAKPKDYQEWIGKESEYTIFKITPVELKYFDFSSGESQPRVLNF